MRKLKKEIFIGLATIIVCSLGMVRCINPAVIDGTKPKTVKTTPKKQAEKQPKKETPKIDKQQQKAQKQQQKAEKQQQKEKEKAEKKAAKEKQKAEKQAEKQQRKTNKQSTSSTTREGTRNQQDGKVGLQSLYTPPTFIAPDGTPLKHPIYSVNSYAAAFPDLQDAHLSAATKWGVTPVRDRQQAEMRKTELVYVGANPYFTIDKDMNYSIPYLVPRASDLLQKISRNFLDSLTIKGIPLHSLIVTSVLRTENDVQRLRRFNTNATQASCHRYGTTFDISYNRYNPITQTTVRNDSLKWVLSEVLRDLRAMELCYVKHEVKQGCFHITVR